MAVYTKVSPEEAAEFLRAYDIGTLAELTGIRQGVENSNYYLSTNKGRFVLTLYEKRVAEEDLPFFIALMEHLAQKNLPSPLPIKTTQGRALNHIAGRPAALTSFLYGRAVTRITSTECAALGKALASMHVAVSDFKMKRVNSLSLPGWEKLFLLTKERANEVYSGLADILGSELAYLKAHWPKNLPSGIIHADLFPDNVLFDGAQLCGLIDFYFACDDFFAYDLAICLNAWCFESNNGAFNITKARALMAGYEAVRPLTKEEKEALPLLSRGSAIRFILTRLYDWINQVPGALVKPKDPTHYVMRLQFHKDVKDMNAYGFSE